MADQGRRSQAHTPGNIACRSYDDAALAQVHRIVDPAPHYASYTTGGKTVTPPTLALAVVADGADPNVAPGPTAGTFLEGANRDHVAIAAFPGAGQSLDIEVWTRSDAEIVAGTPMWLLIDTIAAPVYAAEFLLPTRARDVYLRPINVVLGALPNIPVRACLT